MNYLIAHEAMVARLTGIVEPVEIRDPAGKVLGKFTPEVSAEVKW